MINKKWDLVLAREFSKDYFKNLGIFVKNEYKVRTVYPEYSKVFDALRYTDYNEVKVVILGQDPYHGINEAHGLSFSVREGTPMPPSLRNIFKELYNDIGVKRTQTDLTSWAKQGVLLLNSIMTVVKDSPLSHKDKGWEVFTDKVIELLGERKEPLVFILWGSYARSKKILIKNDKHLIIESPHPSPLSASRGFLGSRPFSRTNNFLEKNNVTKINW